MSGWGVPDWRDPAAYSNCLEWTLPRWIWEVIRRNKDYRQDAMDFLEKMERGWAGDGQYLAWERYHLKWGYCDEVLDPRRSDYADNQLLRAASKGAGVKHLRGSPADRKILRASVEPSPNEIAICFDLDKPFQQQWQSAKLVFENAQKSRHGRKLPPRSGGNGISDSKKKTWKQYLRVIDAINLDASDYEIGLSLNLVSEKKMDHQTVRDAGKSKRRGALEWGANISQISTHPEV